MNDPVLILTAHITAKPETFVQVKSILQSLIEPVSAEEGCLLYELAHNPNNPNEFVFFEKWINELALDNHQRTEHIKQAKDQLDGLLAKDMEMHLFHIVE